MDNVIMPELITPELAEAIAGNPEILATIMGHQPNEEVIVGQNCTLECSGNPTNVKLVFCNVTISVDDAGEECSKGCGARESGEQIGNCQIKIGTGDFIPKGVQWGGLPGAAYQLSQELAVLEARANEIEKILRLIPRLPGTRKVIARCKSDLNELLGDVAAKKMELENVSGFAQS